MASQPSQPSHVVIPCICHSGSSEPCMIPGHGHVPITVAPQDLADAYREMIASIDDAVKHLMIARRAWVSRGLPAEYPIPMHLDREAGKLMAWREQLVKYHLAARIVAARHGADASA